MTATEVPRPRKRDEYVIVFGGRDTVKGWEDLRATKLNALVDAWDFLTRSPMEVSGACHQLRGDLATVRRDGVAYDQLQLELPGGSRIWFYVTARTGKIPGTVVLVRVSTAHPNETKK